MLHFTKKFFLDKQVYLCYNMNKIKCGISITLWLGLMIWATADGDTSPSFFL